MCHLDFLYQTLKNNSNSINPVFLQERDLAEVDNEMSKSFLQICHLTAQLRRLQANVDQQQSTISKHNTFISQSEAEIGRNNSLIERKQTQIDQMNKKIAQKMSKMEGVSTCRPPALNCNLI